MIETRKFTQSTKTYFNIVLRKNIRKRGWLYALLIILGFVHIFLYIFKQQESSIAWMIVCFTYPFVIYIYLYRFAHSKDQAGFLSEKQLFFDEEKIKLVESDGTNGSFPFSRIWSVREEPSFWMLYLSKSQFIYVPKNIFYNEEDFLLFQKSIHS
jgi:hypothetical protein